MSNPLINIRDLNLRLGGKHILKDINLEVSNGKYLALVGPNGAGKTSLIKCLMGIHQSWIGHISLKGKDLRCCTRRALARDLSYVPQAEGSNTPFTCLEFALMSRYPHLSPFTTLRKNDYDLAEQCLEQTGIAALRDRPINTLSGGERQMALIAAALAQGAGAILLDEPTAFLDYHHQQRVMCLLGELNRKRGLTIITVSHDINAACRWSTHIAALRNGRLLFMKKPDEILNHAALQSIYDTRFTFARMPDGRRIACVEDGT